MKWLSLDELAENWTMAHTISVVAWAFVVVLGIALLVHNNKPNTYPVTDQLRVYAAENATFKLPANWTIGNCAADEPFITLPGTIATDYKDKKDYPLQITGTGAYSCIKDRPARLDLYSEKLVASDNPCAPALSTEGEKLGNGLYLQLQEEGGMVAAIQIKQNSCFAPEGTFVLSFSFTDPKAETGDVSQFGSPSIAKDVLLQSRQYHDIHALAESIRY